MNRHTHIRRRTTGKPYLFNGLVRFKAVLNLKDGGSGVQKGMNLNKYISINNLDDFYAFGGVPGSDWRRKRAGPPVNLNLGRQKVKDDECK